MGTNAERQKKYRERAGGKGDKRLNTWISAEAAVALEIIIEHGLLDELRARLAALGEAP